MNIAPINRFFTVISIFIHFSLLSAQNSDAEILIKRDICTINNNKLLETKERIIAIYNRRGERNTEFSIPAYGSTRVKGIEAYITDSNGKKIRQLSKKEIKTVQEYSYDALYEDIFYQKFSLRHNVYPYFIHLKYKVEYSEFLTIADWSPVYNSKYPTKKASLELYVPKDYTVNIKEYLVSSAKINFTGNLKHYKWESNYLDPIKNEAYSPPLESLTPNVKINPSNFVYGLEGSQNSWEDFGNWVFRLTDNLQDLPDNEKNKIDQLISGCTNSNEIVSKLYQYLQDNTRYIAVQLGIGGLKPFPASFVSTNKYGDCKALSNYMRAMLAYAGIESEYTIINSDEENPPLDPSLPGQFFNHVVLMVPEKNDTTWLECTSNSCPPGYMGTSTQDRWALAIGPESSKLVKTPVLSSDQVKTVNSFTFELRKSGNDLVSIRNSYGGEKYEFLSYAVKEFVSKTQREFIESILPFSNFTIKSFKSFIEDRNKAKIVLEIDLEANSQLKKYGNDLVCNILNVHIPDFKDPAKRKLPVWINYPINKLDTLTYKIPYGTQVSDLPKNLQIDSPYGSYSLKVENNTSEVSIIRTFQIYTGKYDLDKYKQFYQFIQEVEQAERKNVILLKE